MKKRILFVGPEDKLPEWATWHYEASKVDPRHPCGEEGSRAVDMASVVYYWNGNAWICCKNRFGMEGNKLPNIEILVGCFHGLYNVFP